MNICEGCIKQDVCKFKEEVESYELNKDMFKFPKPLEVTCKYRQNGGCLTVTTSSLPNYTTETVWDNSVPWDYTI